MAKSIHKIAAIAVTVLLAFLLSGGDVGGKARAAFADTPIYTSVLTDLEKDENFKLEDYPEDEKDNGLYIKQIAESSAGELLIYVYQPAVNVRSLMATTIRLSQSIGENFAPHDYKLTLLNSQGVFQKYRVEGVTVKADTVRYYDITALHRKWDSTIDTPTGNDNTANEVVYEVAKLYTAVTLNGEVKYGCTYKETITITEKYVGFLRYYNGFKFMPDSCDAHYVAFTTDRRMDRLIEAEVEFKAMPKAYGVNVYDEPKELKAKLSEMDEVSTKADGLFATKRTWNRIESIDNFKNDKEFTDEATKGLEGKQWVLSFYETTYTEHQTVTGWIEKTRTEITEVTILRLEFETDGVIYNLGVVDNKQTSGNAPSNPKEETGGFDFWQWLADLFGVDLTTAQIIFWCVVAVIVLAITLPILSALFPVVGQVLKAILSGLLKLLKYLAIGLLWLITSPFRLIAWIVRKISERRQQKPAGKQPKGKTKAGKTTKRGKRRK